MPADAAVRYEAHRTAEWSVRDLLPAPHPHLHRLHDLWTGEAARIARPLPQPSAIGPVQLKQVLPHVHVYDVQPTAPRFRFRLIGTRITELIGSGLTGQSIDSAAQPLRAVILEILSAVESRKAPVHIKAPRALALPSGDRHALESLWLPFGDDAVTRVIAISLVGEAAA